MADDLYKTMSKEELLSVLDMYSKNWLAMDGVWFKSVTIDDRISCECVSCFPDVTDESCACSWLFTLQPDRPTYTV